jgi:hypothetical protein
MGGWVTNKIIPSQVTLIAGWYIRGSSEKEWPVLAPPQNSLGTFIPVKLFYK